ncbi:hypothetical protein PGB90_005329 [Kerria lacca]
MKVFNQLLTKINIQPSEMKALANGDLKITLLSADDYRKFRTSLIDVANPKFHTYRLQDDSPFVIFIHGLHYSTDIKDITASQKALTETTISLEKHIENLECFQEVSPKQPSKKRKNKMNIVFRHFYTTFAEQTLKFEKNYSHVFNQSLFNNLQELSLHLQKNIIYNKDGLIIINKPYGLKKEASKEKEFRQNKINIIRIPYTEANDHLNFNDVITFISGVSILYNNDTWKKQIIKSFRDTLQPLFTYLMVCVGVPIKLHDHVKLGLFLKENNNMKKAVFIFNYSKRSVRQNKVLPVVMNYNTLCINEKLNVSLVEIQNNRNKWNALRAFCSQRLLAPILGDFIYGSCVKTINNKLLPLDPFNPIANYPPKIPKNILSTLELNKKEQLIIPAHIHLVKINFKKLENQSKVFIAKPPDHFLWTCEKLNLTGHVDGSDDDLDSANNNNNSNNNNNNKA